MSSITAIREITLNYILRPEEVIEDARPNVQSDEFIKANATLSGAEYNQDNKILYTILQLHLTDTSGWNVISRFAKEKDGRSAYLALRSRYESPAYKDSEKARATQILSQSLYKGDNLKHTWEKYIANHLEGHRIYEGVYEPISEPMKIDFFKHGIHSEANLESELARGIPDANSSFDSFVNQLTE